MQIGESKGMMVMTIVGVKRPLSNFSAISGRDDHSVAFAKD